MKEDHATWIERRALVNLQNERDQCAVGRSSIHRDFLQLRQRVSVAQLKSLRQLYLIISVIDS